MSRSRHRVRALIAAGGAVIVALAVSGPPRSGPSYAVTTASDNGGSRWTYRPTDRDSAHIVKARTDNGKITVRSAN